MQTSILYKHFLNSAGVCTDTRRIIPNAMFFALRGSNFNGNSFASVALAAGAAFVVIDQPPPHPDPRYILVQDALQTLQHLAAFHRQCLSIPIVAITGTNGKTTTKELVSRVLSAKYNVFATQGNLNNHIGVPLTLLSMNSRTQIGIVEMGANHIGEIASLCRIARPSAGLVTNVGKAHLEGFGSFEGVKKAKAELYQYLAAHSGHIFIHEDNADLAQMLPSCPIALCTPYGEKSLQVGQLPPSGDPYFGFAYCGQTVRTRLVGAYNAANVWAAMAVGRHFGIPDEDILTAIACYEPLNSRSQWTITPHNRLIIDAYNANPASMAAAIGNFAAIEMPRKCLILGEMLELGSQSVAEHLGILRMAEAAGFEEAFFVGKSFNTLPKPRSYLDFETADALAAYLAGQPLRERTILIKGSNGVHLEKIVPML